MEMNSKSVSKTMEHWRFCAYFQQALEWILIHLRKQNMCLYILGFKYKAQLHFDFVCLFVSADREYQTFLNICLVYLPETDGLER